MQPPTPDPDPPASEPQRATIDDRRRAWVVLLSTVLLTCASPAGRADAEAWRQRMDRHRERAAPPLRADTAPRPKADVFSSVSFSPEFAARREAFLAFATQADSGGIYGQLLRAAARKPVQEGAVYRDLLDVDHRNDCADFRLHGLLRMLYQFSDGGVFSADLLRDTQTSVLAFKYWPDEPGTDSMCTWSENHHILFASAGYLAGQLYPDQLFANSGWTAGQTKRPPSVTKLNRPAVARLGSGRR